MNLNKKYIYNNKMHYIANFLKIVKCAFYWGPNKYNTKQCNMIHNTFWKKNS